MLKERDYKKETIMRCHKVLRKMVLSEGMNLIPLSILCLRVEETHWNTGFDSIKEANELGIVCLKCSMDVEIFKLANGII